MLILANQETFTQSSFTIVMIVMIALIAHSLVGRFDNEAKQSLTTLCTFTILTHMWISLNVVAKSANSININVILISLKIRLIRLTWIICNIIFFIDYLFKSCSSSYISSHYPIKNSFYANEKHIPTNNLIVLNESL